MEELLNELNKFHAEKLNLMESCGASTFAEKGDFFIKARSLCKKDYINGYEGSRTIATFTKETFDQVLGEQIQLTKNAIAYYSEKSNKTLSDAVGAVNKMNGSGTAPAPC